MTMYALCFILLLSGCGGGGGGVSSGNNQSGAKPSGPPISWAAKASMSIPRTDFGVATVSGKLYAIGGYSGSVLRTVEEYNPASNSWTTKASMPTARRLLVVTTLNNKIYAIGGMSFTDPNNVTYSYANEEYDPATDTWATKAPMPVGNLVNNILGNRFMGGAAVNGKIYVAVYNNNGNAPITQTLEYDPATDTWSNKAPVPFDYTRFAAASLNGKFFVLADANGFGNPGHSYLAEYDPTKDTWLIKPPTRISRSWTGMVAAAGKLYAVGGVNGSTVLATVEEFDPLTDNWAERASISTPRCSPAIAEIQGRLYVIGGSANNSSSIPQPLSIVEEGLLPSSGAVLQIPTDVGIVTADGKATVSWSAVTGAVSYNLYVASSPALNRNNYAGLPDGRRITGVASPYTLDGLTNGKTYYIFISAVDNDRESEESHLVSATPATPSNLLWKTRKSMPTARVEPGVATVGSNIYVIGGFSGSTLRTVEEYDPASDAWTSKANLPTARRSLVVATVNNKIYAIGGMSYTNPNLVTYTNVTEEYDPATNTWTGKTSIPVSAAYNSILGNRFMGGAAANGKIYVAVFSPGDNKMYEYDPVADTWVTKAPVPIGTFTPYAVTALNNKIYVLDSTSLAEYDPSTNIWIIKAPMPGTRSAAVLVGVPSKNKLYAVGGVDAAGNVLETTDEFDPVGNVWTTRASMPTARNSSGASEVGGKIYVIGGSVSTDRYTPLPVRTVEEGE